LRRPRPKLGCGAKKKKKKKRWNMCVEVEGDYIEK
jgi:hypothetical protein